MNLRSTCFTTHLFDHISVRIILTHSIFALFDLLINDRGNKYIERDVPTKMSDVYTYVLHFPMKSADNWILVDKH